MRVGIYFLLSSLFIFFQSNAQDLQHPEKYTHLYQPAYELPYPKRWDIIDSIRNAVFANLNNHEGAMFRSKIEELAAQLHKDEIAELICYLQKMDYMQLTSTVPINVFEQWYIAAVKEAERLKFDEVKIFATITYSYYLSEKYNKHALSLYYANKCYQYTMLAKEIRPHSNGYIFHSIANRFYKFDDFENAIMVGKQVIKFPKETYYRLFTLNLIGMSYLKLKNYDSAIVYFNNSIVYHTAFFAPAHAFNGWQGILKGNKASAFKEKGLIDSAIYNYKLAIEDTYQYNVLDNTCGFVTNLADIYLTRKEITAASQLLPLAINTTSSSGKVEDKLQLQQLLSKYYTLTGKLALAILHKDSAHQWADSLKERTGKNVRILAELNLETEKRKNLEQSLQSSINNQRKNMLIAVIVILLTAVIASFLLVRQRLLLKVKQKELQLQQQEAARKSMLQEQAAKQERLIDKLKLDEFAQMIGIKDQQIKLLEELTTNAPDTESIEALKKSTILTNEQWDEFKIIFERVHTGFFDRLLQKLPDLTQAETRLLALTKLKLSTREMAALQGISPHAVRTIGYRLRKKYQLADSVNIEDLVETV